MKRAPRSRRHPPPFLLDTHVWFWYLTGSARLPASLAQAIDAAPSEVWLSPISVWELGILAQRGRIRLDGGVRKWSEEAQRRFPLHEAGLNREVAIVSLDLDLAHRDPADHFLAATALVHELTLLTVDDRLTSAAWLRTRSE